MSSIDKIKEQKEYACFLDAYNYSLNKPVPQQTKEILKFLNGEYIIRKKNDAPDIVTICLKNNNQQALVGIEHFNVSSISKTTTTGKNISLHKLHISNLSKINDEMISQIQKTGYINDEIIEKNNIEVGALAEDAINGTYEAFIHSFQTAWIKHSSNIDNYIMRTKSLAEERKILTVEIAFLIEIDTEFFDFFYNSDEKVMYDNSGLIPIFKDVISIINSTANLFKINYIIFYNRNINKSNQSVVAFKTDSIENNLHEQGILIYEYIGENYCKVKVDSIETDGETPKVKYQLKKYPEKFIKNELFSMYRKAKSLKDKHIPFVASRSVQHLLFIDPDSCSDKNERLRRSRQFSAKYSKDNKK